MPEVTAIPELKSIGYILLAIVVSGVLSLLLTPIVKVFSVKIGAVDVPKDGRRMHDHPIPRLGGLAIFLAFMVSVLIFVPLDTAKKGMLLGAVIIVILGIFDDIHALSAKLKFLVQLVAALVATLMGNRIEVLTNPNIFSDNPIWELGWLSFPVTVIWIVAITNAVNLIDGLDGLACGVSTISSLTMLVIALLVSNTNVATVMAALVGACIGFLPYNFNPAKIFMGDTGSLFLGSLVASLAFELKNPFLAITMGGVYVIEGVSVILQVICFKIAKKRLFKMAPIHHHLEKCGWDENKICLVAITLTLIFSIPNLLCL